MIMVVRVPHHLLLPHLLLLFLLVPLPSHASVKTSHVSVRDSHVSVKESVANCLDQLFHADVAFWEDSQVKMLDWGFLYFCHYH